VHGLSNETNDPIRYLMASALVSPEVAEYRDLNQITARLELDHCQANACG